jgi:hypothetical protein
MLCKGAQTAPAIQLILPEKFQAASGPLSASPAIFISRLG